MNTPTHCLVFNKSRGCLKAFAENAYIAASVSTAVMTGVPQVALSYEIAAGVTALLEQAYQPSLGKVASGASLDFIAKTYAEMSGVPRIIVDEIVNSQIKPLVEAYGDLLDKKLGYKK